MALAVTLGFVVSLDRLAPRPEPFGRAPVRVLLRPLPVPIAPPPPAPRLATSAESPPAPTRPVRQPDTGREPSRTGIAAGPADDRTGTAPAAAPSPSAAASQAPPLQLELTPGAARAARGTVRGMAATAGIDLGDERPGIPQRMAAEVARSAKPDCLAADEHASLLSAFVIVYEAARGRCR